MTPAAVHPVLTRPSRRALGRDSDQMQLIPAHGHGLYGWPGPGEGTSGVTPPIWARRCARVVSLCVAAARAPVLRLIAPVDCFLLVTAPRGTLES
jgi:hypothetical protein